MFTNLNNLTKKRRVGGDYTNKAIKLLLYARGQLLVSYYKLIGMKPQKDIFTTLDEYALSSFCYKLMDYLSIGHFVLYERILNKIYDKNHANTTCHIFLLLESNTQHLMQLYDNYLQQSITDDNCMKFQQVLSRVCEVLESRFTLEDKLIQLVNNH